MRIEQITEPMTYHGEGPVWSPRWGGLRWVDMLAGDVLCLGAAGEVDRDTLSEISTILTEHVRFEEKELFPLIERLIPEEQLYDLATVGRCDV
jgi:hypothetical protein